VKSIFKGMKSIVESKNKFISPAMTEVKKYSWQKTARMTLDVYNELKVW
jgi:hypothetical protein